MNLEIFRSSRFTSFPIREAKLEIACHSLLQDGKDGFISSIKSGFRTQVLIGPINYVRDKMNELIIIVPF
jgi:hypothetical protein